MNQKTTVEKKVAELEREIKKIENGIPGLGSQWLKELKARHNSKIISKLARLDAVQCWGSWVAEVEQ